MHIELNDETRLQVIQLLKSGNKIEAIKVVKEASGCGLKEAKDFVEALVDSHNENLPDNQRIPKGGCLMFLGLLLPSLGMACYGLAQYCCS